MITVNPALINLPAGNNAPTPTDIVNEAYRFYNYYGWVPNTDDCCNIASAVAAGVGATIGGPTTWSLAPAENQNQGFWRIVYRGSDPNPVSNWQTLLQPGDIVRMEWTTGGPHATTVLSVNPDGSMVVYDNSDFVNGAYGIGVHTVKYDQDTIPSSITIYRLTSDDMYLQTGDDAGDTIFGTGFNNEMIGGAGNDIFYGGPKKNVVDGGGGFNTVGYSGALSQYQISQSGNSIEVVDSRAGSPDGTDQLTNIQSLQFADRSETAPVVTASKIVATHDQTFVATSLFTVSDAEGNSIVEYALWDSGVTSHFIVNGVVQGSNVEIDVTAAQLAQTSLQSGSGTDQLWARAFDGILWGTWEAFSITAPVDTGPVETVSNQTAVHGQSYAGSSLFSYSDPFGSAAIQYDFWDTGSGGGHFVLNGMALGANQDNIVTAAQLSQLTYQPGSGTDTLWVRADDGTVWGVWSNPFTVTVPMPTLTVHNDPAATVSQTLALSSLVTISDPDGVGYQKLELWDSNGTVAGGQFVVNGVAQTGGHEIDVTPANVAGTVFDAGTTGGTDTLWARLQQNDGTLTGWQQFSVTVPTPTLTVHNDPTATNGQAVSLSTLVTIADPGAVSYQKLELWDSNGTVAGGQFVVNSVAQTGGHEIDVSPANVAGTVFDAGTSAGTDTLWARLQQDDGTLTGWQQFSVTVPTPTLTVHNDPTATNGQAVSLSTLVTIVDPGAVSYQKLELWDSNGTVAGGQFVVNSVAQTGGHEIDVTPANVAGTVFDAGTSAGTDTLWARLQQDDGTLTGWQQFSVTVPTPTLTVHNDPTATNGQAVSLSTLVTIVDPGAVSYQKLELWDI